jgi:hypothetical protein
MSELILGDLLLVHRGGPIVFAVVVRHPRVSRSILRKLLFRPIPHIILKPPGYLVVLHFAISSRYPLIPHPFPSSLLFLLITLNLFVRLFLVRHLS